MSDITQTTNDWEDLGPLHKDAYGRVARVRRQCDVCDGKGIDWGETCLTCGGEGFVCNDEKIGCAQCGEEDISPNVEAFEVSGQIVCDECAEEIFKENGQFGVGA